MRALFHLDGSPGHDGHDMALPPHDLLDLLRLCLPIALNRAFGGTFILVLIDIAVEKHVGGRIAKLREPELGSVAVATVHLLEQRGLLGEVGQCCVVWALSLLELSGDTHQGLLVARQRLRRRPHMHLGQRPRGGTLGRCQVLAGEARDLIAVGVVLQDAAQFAGARGQVEVGVLEGEHHLRRADAQREGGPRVVVRLDGDFAWQGRLELHELAHREPPAAVPVHVPPQHTVHEDGLLLLGWHHVALSSLSVPLVNDASL
mmetsp:Transcript_102701/g.260888  ORF Transcript_102701/g.260888 Transcript_102701/m.260888 type:complete len:260 (+) Transcript_102701:485-1264(+)